MIRYLSVLVVFFLVTTSGLLAQTATLVTVDDDLLEIALGYEHQVGMLRSAAVADNEGYESSLDSAMAVLDRMLYREEITEDPRFRELYRSVVTEYETYYDSPDTFTTAFGEIGPVRDELFAYVESDDLVEDLLIENIQEFETTIPIIHNSLVERSIVYLMRKPEKTVDLWRARAETYFPMVEKILEEEGAPEELKYLALIESGLVPHARSWARAAGMWQFISATGKMYGLRVSRWSDERMDPEKATRAAARHLLDLYELFNHDWHLAMAGYNCSPARVKRAIRKVRRATGKEPTFFDIYRYLPRETRAYVPMFMAAAIVMSHPEKFELKDVEPGPRYEFDVVAVHHMVSLETVAEWTGSEVAALKALNPEIRRGFVPPTEKPYMLRIPLRTSRRFAEAYEPWAAENPKINLVHVVKSGESINKVSKTYGVSVSEIRNANGLSRNTLQAGQDLQIPVVPFTSKSSEEMYAIGPRSIRYRQPSIDPVAVANLGGSSSGPGVNIRTVAARSQKSAKSINSGSGSSSAAKAESGSRVRYRVKRGDTLSGIAKKYSTNVSSIKNWNSLRSSRIRSGQVLTLYSGGDSSSVTHRVSRGQTLSSIARRYGVSIGKIKSSNSLKSDRIYVGQRLTVPQ
jgi:membrane-bound lytic murein transglycosylase D